MNESNFSIIGQFLFWKGYEDFLCSFRKQRTKEIDIIAKASEHIPFRKQRTKEVDIIAKATERMTHINKCMNNP